MLEVLGLVVVWLLFGVLVYGQFMGINRDEFVPVLGIEKEDITIGLMMALFGPLGLLGIIPCIIHTGKFWRKPCWQFRTSQPTDPSFRGE